MKNKPIFITTARKLALTNTIIFILIATILYFALPVVLNYPPNSIDNDFQIRIVGIKYSTQFLILISILVILLYILLRVIYSKCTLGKRDLNTLSAEEIHKIRKKCTNYPYLMLLLEISIPAIIVSILLFFFNTEPELNLRISIVIFSFASIFAILSYMISKDFFVNMLVQTSSIVENKVEGIRLKLKSKLLLQLVPLFLYSFVLILLIATTLMTTEKGDLLYHFYHQELLSMFDSNTTYSIEEIKDKLNTIDLKSDGDHILMISAKDGEVIYSPDKLNDFFINYTLDFYDKTDGYIYEYYGQNIEGTVFKIHSDIGDVYARNTFLCIWKYIYCSFPNRYLYHKHF